MKPKILLRKTLAEEQEFDAASKYFEVIEHRQLIKKDDLIIPRYSALPYYNELYTDCVLAGADLIQSPHEHRWIADFEWYNELSQYTFKTWKYFDNPKLPEGQYVIKGATNSKKFSWDRAMYAPNKKRAYEMAINLLDDSLIGPQGVLFREYIPLKADEVGCNNLPFADEWRFFFLENNLIDHGYYWSIAENIDKPTPEKVIQFAKEIANIACQFTNFFVLDVALKQNNEPILVEINCGTMSGLSCIDPDRFYKNLKINLDLI